MIVAIDNSGQMRAAFEAGRAAGAAPFVKRALSALDVNVTEVPQSYEEWIESVRRRPQVAVG